MLGESSGWFRWSMVGLGFAGATLAARPTLSGVSAGTPFVFSCAVPFVWTAPTSRDWLLMAVMGVLAAIGHFFFVTAHRFATASELAPYGYTEIASAVAFGFLLFGDWPKALVWLGILLIVASGIGATWREARGGREARGSLAEK